MIGYKSIVEDGVRWRENQGGLFPLSPPGMVKHFNSQSAKSLLRGSGEVFVRWETDFDQISGSDWWHVIKDESVSLETLSSNTRSKVRRGLKAFCCEPISRHRVLSEGYEVYQSAFTRYTTHEKEYSAAEFAKAIECLPDQAEFWGVLNKSTNELVAFSENYVEADTCFYNTIWFEPSALRKYSSYALFFEMTRYYLEDRGFKYVSDGARSLSHETKIHDFLESKFGYRKAYARIHVAYVPWLDFVVRCAYPFRKQMSKLSFGPFKKASILLKQEEIRRSCARVAG